jgi:hypothetical protein
MNHLAVILPHSEGLEGGKTVKDSDDLSGGGKPMGHSRSVNDILSLSYSASFGAGSWRKLETRVF